MMRFPRFSSPVRARRSASAPWCLLPCFLHVTGAHAVEATLCNDDFAAGDNVSFQGGFAADEAAAVKLAPPVDGYPFTISRVQLLYGDDGSTAGEGFNVTARILDDDGTAAVTTDEGYPGTQLGEQVASLLSSPEGVNEIVFDIPVTVTDGAVWIAIFFGRAGFPSVAAEVGGSFEGSRNAIFAPGTGGWESSELFGLTGDWIVRAVVDTPSTTTNAACVFEGAPVGEGEGEGEGGGEGEGEGEGEGPGEGEGETGALVVTSVNPSSGVVGESVRVTITGGGFTDATTFRVGSSVCGEVTVDSDGAALCTVPPDLAPGTYDVVAQSGVETFVFASGFSVVAAGCSCASASTGVPALAACLMGWAAWRGRTRTPRRRASGVTAGASPPGPSRPENS